MNIIDHFSGQGMPHKNNEDIWGHSDSAVWIFDGATGLSKDNLVAQGDMTDPRWLVECANYSLEKHADKIEDIQTLYGKVLHDCEVAFDTEKKREPNAPYELPMAASIIVKQFAGRVICGALSDCTMLIETKYGLQKMEACQKHAAIDDKTRVKMLEAVKSGLSPTQAREHLIPHLQNNRMRANCNDGYDVFAPVKGLEKRVRVEMFEPADDGHILLMTDGFYALVEQYKAYDDDNLMDAVQTKGFETLYKELRDIEEDDSALTLFPRFKKSDDATAVLFKF